MTQTLMFVVTEDWYFHSHRLTLALHARDAGYAVCVATRCARHAALLRAHGLEVIDIPFDRSLRRPDRDWASWRALRRLLHARRPDLVHAVSLKPILLALAAAPERARCIAAFTGLGYIFSSGDRRARLLRGLVRWCLRHLLSGARAWTLVQNDDDRALLAAAGIGTPARTVLIAGAGVDLAAFPAMPETSARPPLVLLPARLLVDKGVHEFVAAARTLRAAGVPARFVLAGQHDTDNPGAVSTADLAAWQRDGIIEWAGHRDDMAAVYASATVVCLPSYREGLPKVLLEAGATGRALVTTDVPGCRDVVEHGVTGLLVRARDSDALAGALRTLLADSALRTRLAAAMRRRIEERFAITTIAAETLALYERVRQATVDGLATVGGRRLR